MAAIALPYGSRGLLTPKGLHTHSTRGLSSSWVLFRRVSIQEVCAVASWAPPHTFARFYRLDVKAPTLASLVLSVIKSV